MAASESQDMGFVPMSSISKVADPQAKKCSDWVATEKVHGSSFQMFSDDGVSVRPGSRRRNLDGQESFIRCNIKELMKKYKEYALKMWHIIHSGDRWEDYREPSTEFEDDEDDVSDNDNEEVEESDANSDMESNGKETDPENDLGEMCRVRIYGELYGGGGIKLPVKSAAQKEILYCDEFRFYVFGLTINKKWVTIYELNDLCKEAGFPYYAKPVCEPMSTVEDLKQHLTDIGFMRTRSSLTELEGDNKTHIEGVVMTPLKRPDFKLHAVKFLATAFVDVKESCFGATKTANFCTKQRYHSVISKLDIHERKDTKLVVNMFIEDILKESQLQVVGYKLKEKWAKILMGWLEEDEYNPDPSALDEALGKKPQSKQNRPPKEFTRNKEEEEKKRAERKKKEETDVMDGDDDDEPMSMGLFDL